MAGKTIKDVEIFAAGTWNGMKFVQEDLAAIANLSNTLAAQTRAPLKLGHNDAQPLMSEMLGEPWDGQPALGHAENFRAKGSKIIADFVDVNETIYEAISKGLYSQISVEMWALPTSAGGSPDGEGWYISGVAILGADTPAVSTLKDLQAYLSARTPGGSPATPTLSFSLSQPHFSREIKTMSEQPKGPTADEQAAFAVAQAKLKADQEALDKRSADIEEQARTLAFAKAREAALEPVEKLVKDGKITPAIRDEIAAELDEHKASFKTGDDLGKRIERMVKMAALASPKMPQGEEAAAGDGDGPDAPGPGDVLADAVLEYSAKHNVDYITATERLRQTQPKLFKAHVRDFVEPTGRGLLN